MKVKPEQIKLLAYQAEVLKQQLAAVEKEFIDLSMREKALHRMISQSTARCSALSADLVGHEESSGQAACPSKMFFEAHVPSSSMMQCPSSTGTDASAGAQDLDVCGLATEHIAYIARASVLVIRMGTCAARPGDLAELEELTRRHYANILKTALRSVQTLWICYGLNFETGEVEEAPDELFPDVLNKVGLTQEQMLTLAAGAQASLCCMLHVACCRFHLATVLLTTRMWCDTSLLLSDFTAWKRGLLLFGRAIDVLP